MTRHTYTDFPVKEELSEDDIQLSREALKRLAHIGEVRQQLSLLAQIAEKMSQFQEIRRFQEIVISEIGKCDEETRNRILARLEQAYPTGTALDLS